MRVLLFGMIAEKAGATEIVANAVSLNTLRKELEERIIGLAQMRYALAVDRRIEVADRPLNGDEEIAVLPPFAGG